MIPRSWLIIGAGAVLLLSNGMTGCAVREYYVTAAKAERADASRRALEEKNRREAEIRSAESKQAEAVRNVEEKYLAEIADIRASSSDFQRFLSAKLRLSENRVSNCDLPSAAPNPSPTEIRSTGEIRLGQIDIVAVSRVREIGKEMQETLRLCREWSSKTGR